MTLPLRKLKDKGPKESAVCRTDKTREAECVLAQALIEARTRAGLTQAQLAKRMHTKQSAIARIERGSLPSYRTLLDFAEQTGNRLQILFLAKETSRTRTVSSCTPHRRKAPAVGT